MAASCLQLYHLLDQLCFSMAAKKQEQVEENDIVKSQATLLHASLLKRNDDLGHQLLTDSSHAFASVAHVNCPPFSQLSSFLSHSSTKP